MKSIIALSFVGIIGLSIFAQPGDTYNCNGGHWVVLDEVAKCVAGAGSIPPGTVPLPTPAYTADPLIPSCRPVPKQTPTPMETKPGDSYMVNLPFIANGE